MWCNAWTVPLRFGRQNKINPVFSLSNLAVSLLEEMCYVVSVPLHYLAVSLFEEMCYGFFVPTVYSTAVRLFCVYSTLNWMNTVQYTV